MCVTGITCIVPDWSRKLLIFVLITIGLANKVKWGGGL